MSRKYVSTSVLVLISLTIAACDALQEANRMGAMSDSTQQDTTTTDVTATRDANGREAALLSAFFGIDNGLPRAANRGICRGAAGKDGMPVIFSTSHPRM